MSKKIQDLNILLVLLDSQMIELDCWVLDIMINIHTSHFRYFRHFSAI